MTEPPNVTPLRRPEPPAPEDDFNPEDYEGYTSTRLAKLRTSRNGKEAQLWLCLEADDSLTIKWMAPTKDPDTFEPLSLGSISVAADELANLGELLQGAHGPVAKLLEERRALR